ncbi:class I adenylate-forming enzyme family protein [Haloferula sp. BvORR071]|uniref:class I adenylate-forming enzyme family protein n=1 Tax=Haloferula sp. BvORR071 TaxID=1396141 RepID=UPI000558E8D5|nr:class I adenylate-forming enzyme family protein [Haloferula sp. BvORR071]
MNLIEEIAHRHDPATIAIVSGDTRASYGDLFGEARRIAELLKAHNRFGRIPRIGLQCPNGLSYIVLSMGILLGGACLVPLAEELRDAERSEIADTTSLDLILAAGDLPWHGPEDVIAEHTSIGVSWKLHLCRPATPRFPEEEFQKLNPAFIRFSSGTTGTSKGVVLSHETLLARISAANEGLKIGPEDRVLWMLPMAHHFAVSIVLYLYFGATTVLENSPLREDVLATADRSEATVIYGSPFHFAMLSGDRGDFMWPSLRLAVATAAALPEATARAFDARFGKPLTQGLGIIEVGLSVLNIESAREKPEALGRPMSAYEVALLDEAGSPVAEGEAGEFHVRGPGLLDAYLVPWNADPSVDGWFASGDLVRRDAEGDLFLMGRKKSVINVAGMKVFPEEVERVLNEHPAVKRSRVLGREHPQMGQVPVAEIIPADATAPPKPVELQRFCKQVLSAYKVPMQFKMVEELPLTASGKLKRG